MKHEKQKGFTPVVLVLLVVLGVGVVGGGYALYKDKQKQEKLETQIQDLQNQIADNTSDAVVSKVVDKNLTVSLVVQAGLPAVVEAKRQAIYRAAFSRDLKKLEAEAYATYPPDFPNPPRESISFYSYDAQGKEKLGLLSGFSKFREHEKNISIFDLYPFILNSPFAVTDNMYTWPSVATKESKNWSASEISSLKAFLTDEQIEEFKNYYYTYPKITITSDGKWINHSFFWD